MLPKGDAIRKLEFLKPREIIVINDLAKFQEMFIKYMHHTISNQCGVLMNFVHNIVKNALSNGLVQRQAYLRPCY